MGSKTNGAQKAAEKEQEELMQQREAQARKLQQQRINLLRGQLGGGNLGFTPQTQLAAPSTNITPALKTLLGG